MEKIEIEQILTVYKDKFKFDNFYDNLFYNMATWPDKHFQNNNFLRDYPWPKKVIIFQPQKPTVRGNIRVDLPVWFGKLDAPIRILVVGMEPRDTDKKNGYLNIEHKNNYVFATPFALERLGRKYQNAFRSLTKEENIFSYFTDAVKTYEVRDEVDKTINDNAARKVFKAAAEAGFPLLKKEICIIKPTKIIALGRESHLFLSSRNIEVVRVTHPAAWVRGGSNVCATQIEKILEELI